MLWSDLLDHAIEIADDRVDRLQQDVAQRYEHTHVELDGLKERLRLAESAIDDARARGRFA